ncbi:MAG: transcriptional regulator NrdR [Gammaproteobacteria bacterium]|nr:transcriptional regulator NrdR [Gammaproteobacteria bacterium]
MHCPFCKHEETRVVDSRLAAGGSEIRRRRECLACKARFSTIESGDFILPRVVKQDGSRVPFDEEKLRAGILKALEKRPVPTEAVDAEVARLIEKLRLAEEREIASSVIGEWVMAALARLDPVAYVRFASVYQRFEDLDAFRREIERLEGGPGERRRRSRPPVRGSGKPK